jgi:hypothetical protein
MVRLHGRSLAEQRAEAAAVLHLDLMVGEDTGGVLVLLVADDLRQVLEEIASAGDVQHLRSTAYREYRHVSLERRREQGQLAAVPLRSRPGRLRVRLLAVLRRVDV